MRWVPVLLRPRILGGFNIWRRGLRLTSHLLRDATVLLFGIAVMLAIFNGTSLALRRIDDLALFAYLPPRIPLSMIFLFLMAMLTLSSTAVAFGSLFLSADNELVLASPISQFRFYLSKYLSILLSTAWMPLTFLFPFLGAFYIHYGGEWDFLIICSLALIPYFLIPVGFSIILVHLILVFLPPQSTKLLLSGLLIGIIFLIGKAASIITSGLQAGQDYEQMLQILSTLSLKDVHWLPSQWASLSLHFILVGELKLGMAPLGLLWSTALSIFFLSYLIFLTTFQKAYTRAMAGSSGQVFSLGVGKWFRRPRYRLLSMATKDLKSMFRDMAQITQLLLLLSIYLVYLYNLRIFGFIHTIGITDRSTWMVFFFITNASMAAFVTTAAATRLVFPAISLEGRAFWILQTSPITMEQLFWYKFWTWFPLIGTLASITFTAGNVALGAGWSVLLATFVVSWLMSASIIALGVAIGALFARFDWEHTAQLVASFGSFVFMLGSILLVVLNMIPLGFALYLRTPGMSLEKIDSTYWNLILASLGLLILLLNALILRFSFMLGKRALVGHYDT